MLLHAVIIFSLFNEHSAFTLKCPGTTPKPQKKSKEYNPLTEGAEYQKRDPTKVDFCKLECDYNKVEGSTFTPINTACDCNLDRWRTHSSERRNIQKFRQEMLDWHNYYRSLAASGYEKYQNLPKAADMMVLNYDVELEHVARCIGKAWKNYHDDCRRTTRFYRPGQNLKGNYQIMPPVHWSVAMWYLEKHMATPDLITCNQNIPPYTTHDFGHYTQMVSSYTRYVGCATYFNPNGSEDSTPSVPIDWEWRSVVICNYGGTVGPNGMGAVVYTPGEPCSHCPKGTKCNKRWPLLCGELEPLPQNLEKEETEDDSSRSKRSSSVSLHVHCLLAVKMLIVYFIMTL